LDTRAAIDAAIGIKETMDFFGKFAIFSLMFAWFPPSPIVIATDTHTQYSTHGTHGKLLSVFSNERIT